jgi:hypothetical protein
VLIVSRMRLQQKPVAAERDDHVGILKAGVAIEFRQARGGFLGVGRIGRDEGKCRRLSHQCVSIPLTVAGVGVAWVMPPA